MEPYPWHGTSDCDCGCCQAIFQRHNEYQKCNCPGCSERAIIPIHQAKWEKKVSTLNICDRCETPATSNAMGNFTKRLSLAHAVESFELCPGCVFEFVSFMLGTSQDRPKAYKEPYTEQAEPTDRTLRQALRELMRGGDDDPETDTGYVGI